MGCATSSIGAYLSVSSSEPATQDESGFASLTYTEIGEALSLPAFGGTAAVTSNTPLKTGTECKSQGAINWGSMAINALYIDEEAGHVIMRSGLNGAFKGQDMAFELTYPNGAVRYLRGFVSMYTENPGDASSNIMMDTSIELNYEPIYVAAA